MFKLITSVLWNVENWIKNMLVISSLPVRYDLSESKSSRRRLSKSRRRSKSWNALLLPNRIHSNINSKTAPGRQDFTSSSQTVDGRTSNKHVHIVWEGTCHQTADEVRSLTLSTCCQNLKVVRGSVKKSRWCFGERNRIRTGREWRYVCIWSSSAYSWWKWSMLQCITNRWGDWWPLRPGYASYFTSFHRPVVAVEEEEEITNTGKVENSRVGMKYHLLEEGMESIVRNMAHVWTKSGDHNGFKKSKEVVEMLEQLFGRLHTSAKTITNIVSRSEYHAGKGFRSRPEKVLVQHRDEKSQYTGNIFHAASCLWG